MLALPVVSSVSSLAEVADMKPLNKEEKESGETAIAALLYQEGANIDARLLCLLWAASISAPRLAQLAKDHKSKKARAKNPAGSIAAEIETAKTEQRAALEADTRKVGELQ